VICLFIVDSQKIYNVARQLSTHFFWRADKF
jgi:hypothetical protein